MFQGLNTNKFGTPTASQGLGGLGGGGGGLGINTSGIGTSGGLGTGLGGGGLGAGLGGGGIGGGLGGGGLGMGGTGTSTGMFNAGATGGGGGGMFKTGGMGLGGGGLGGTGTGLGGGLGTGTGLGSGLGGGGGLGGGAGMFQTPSSSSGYKFGGLGGGGTSNVFGQSSGLGGGVSIGSSMSTPLMGHQSSTANTFGIGGATGGGLGMGGGLGGTGGMGLRLGGNTAGTPAPFIAVKGTDSMLKGGTSYSINTILHCATAMKEYEQKSLEELRYEDYECGRKGKMAGLGMMGGAGMLGGLGGLSSASTSLGGGGLGGGMFSQSSGLMGGTSKAGMFSSTGTGLGLGMGLGNQSGIGTSTGLMGQPGLGGGGLGGLGANQNPLGMKTGLGTGGIGTGLGGLNTSQATGLGMGGGLGGGMGTGLGGGMGTGLGGGGMGTGLGGGMGTGLGGGGMGTGLGGGGMGTGLGGGGGMGTGLGVGGLGNKPLGLGGTSGTGLGMGTGLGGQTGMGMGLGGNTGLGMGQSKLGQTGMGMGLGTGLGAGMGTGMGLGQTAGMGMVNNPMNNLTAQQQQAQLQQQIEILRSAPFGDSPLFRNSMSDSDKKTKPSDSTPISHRVTPITSPHYKLNIRSSTKCKPMSYNSPGLQKDKSKLFEGLDDSIASGNESFTPRSSIKKLTIKPRPNVPSPLPLPDSTSPPYTASQTAVTTPSSTVAPPTSAFSIPPVTTTPSSLPKTTASPYSNPLIKPKPIRVAPASTPVTTVTSTHSMTSSTPAPSALPPLPVSPPTPPISSQLTLTKDGYYTKPPLPELLQKLDEEGTCVVENFTVGRRNHGEVLFIGKTDVQGLDLDQLVVINPQEVAVYPDDYSKPKPPVGQGLNKKARVRLEGYWPICKTKRVPIKDPDRLAEIDYVGKLRKSTEKIGAHFIDYIPDKGTCIFEVDHFSKYKLVADDDDSDGDSDPADKKDTKGTGTGTKGTGTGTKGTGTGTKGAEIGKKPVKLPIKTSQTGLGAGQSVVSSTTVDTPSDDNEDFEDAIEHMAITQSGPRPLEPSFKLAKSIGLDSHQMQVMKASFFDDEQHYSKSASSQPTTSGTLFKPVLMEWNTQSSTLKSGPRPSMMPHPQVNQSSLEESLTEDRVQTVIPKPMWPQPHTSVLKTQSHVAPVAQPQTLIPKYRLSRIVSMENSLIAKEESGMFKDAGHFMSRMFRSGWSLDWTIVHSGHRISPEVPSAQHHQPHGLFSSFHVGQNEEDSNELEIKVIREKLDASPWMKTTNEIEKKAFYEPLLNVQLKNSRINSSGDSDEMVVDDDNEEVPMFEPLDSQQLLKDLLEVCVSLSMESEPQLRQQLVDVFSLVDALWGQEIENEDKNKNGNGGGLYVGGAYAEQAYRRKRLSTWLKSVNKRKEPRINKDTIEEVKYLLTILYQLAQFNLVQATTTAHKHKDHKLALLISQSATGHRDNRLLLHQQLNDWDKLEAHMLIHPWRLVLYCILAGQLVWDGQGVHINSCDSLDWRQALGLHLWYSSSPVASIKDILTAYTEAFQDDDYPYAAPPTPPYISSEGPSSLVEGDPLDTCYHLLCLYCLRDHSMEFILSPAGSTHYQLDHRLSWHLWSVLSSIGYSHTHPSYLASLHCSYSAQLESLGAWQWAVFVAQHIEDPVLRCHTVEGVVSRHCTSNEELNEQEQFVIDKLSVSRCVVYKAKALRAQYDGLHTLQALHLVEACLWNEAHEIIIKHVAPQAIKSEDTGLLMKLLDGLVSTGNCNNIHDWDSMGSVYYDYLQLLSKLQEQSEAADFTPHELEEVFCGLQFLAPRLSNLPAETPDECLSRTEMAKNTATFLRTVHNLREEHFSSLMDQDVSVDLVVIISKLPMPVEYVLAEIRILSSL